MNAREHIQSFFSEDSPLSNRAGFEHRPQQQQMADAIVASLEKHSHLVVEAPTGVGKSLAYLVPAILHAVEQKRKAIVSTHTKNLQEQLIKKDIEIVRSLLPTKFDAVLLKGRKNYLCASRLRNALHQQRQLFEKEETRELLKIQEWAQAATDGDIENLPFALNTKIWQQVCSERGACSHLICGASCFFQKAKERARTAHLVVMNHALFFTLLASQSQREYFLFKDDFVIFDEAHTLESVAGVGIGKSLSRAQVLFAIHRLYNPRTNKGLLSRLRKKELLKLCEETEESANQFFDEVVQTTRLMNERSNAVRISTPRFVANTVEPNLQRLQTGVKELMENEKTKINKEELAAANRLVWEAEILIREFLDQENSALTYWVETSDRRSNNVFLHAAPTDVSESVGPMLFRENASVIMTSATLSVNGALDYFQRRLGATSAQALILDTPFNFQRQMRLAIARDIPTPDEASYAEELPRWILSSIARTKGKALVLFTSASLMKQMALIIEDELTTRGIRLLVQEYSASRHRLLEEFKRDVHSVLFGLDSFWMGIDVPGEALEHVIITRLPFAVPDHPLVQSRMELIAKQGGNSFMDYTLPEAVLKFRQGVGRLIRSKSDTGIITILDSRIAKKQYGQVFVNSIPRCPIEIMNVNGEIEEYAASE
ncbi:MAG: DEAD/DEAH box helicase [Ignavibacteriales bacterium]|nr:DEAD/DEAH box helicase [Ignavibacteriales bacterium]